MTTRGEAEGWTAEGGRGNQGEKTLLSYLELNYVLYQTHDIHTHTGTSLIHGA